MRVMNYRSTQVNGEFVLTYLLVELHGMFLSVKPNVAGTYTVEYYDKDGEKL